MFFKFIYGHHFLIHVWLTNLDLHQVRNEKVEEFLALLKEWERLCAKFSLIGDNRCQQQISSENESNHEDEEDEEVQVDNEEIFEVDQILSLCYGLPEGQKEVGLYFKVLDIFLAHI